MFPPQLVSIRRKYISVGVETLQIAQVERFNAAAALYIAWKIEMYKTPTDQNDGTVIET